MPLITRQGKGSKLTIAEMDGNLEYLESNGFVNGAYSQTYIGSGAIIDTANIIYDPSPLTDAAVGTYTISPIGGGGSGAQFEVVISLSKGELTLNFSSIIDGGLGYELSDVLTFSSNDIGGTLDETISLTLDVGCVDVNVSSSITVATDRIAIDTPALGIPGNVEVTGTIDAGVVRAQNINGNASLDFLTVFNGLGGVGGTVVAFQNLPTTDPQTEGYLWVDAANGYVLKVSQG